MVSATNVARGTPVAMPGMVSGAGTRILASVVLPAFNEAAALPLVLADLFAVLCEYPDVEVVVVDDGSTDATAAIASQYPCHLIRHAVNQGKGAALRTGIAHARGAYVITMDADSTYPAAAIPRLVSLLGSHDLVRCTRQSDNSSMPTVNRLGNGFFDWLLGRFMGLSGKDYLSGLYGIRREALQALDLESSGFDIEVEIGIKARSLGLTIATFPITYQPRVGEKKLDAWHDGWRILRRILAMALLHNPVGTFIIPGAVLLAIFASFAIMLREGPLVTPYFGLSINSFILAALGVLAAFQLVVFGVAAELYGLEAGHRPRVWLVRLSSQRARFSGAIAGLVLATWGLVQTVALIAAWTSGGAHAFEDTRSLVVASVSLVWGLQMISAALFLSIFAGRLQQHHRPAPPEPGELRVEAQPN